MRVWITEEFYAEINEAFPWSSHKTRRENNEKMRNTILFMVRSGPFRAFPTYYRFARAVAGNKPGRRIKKFFREAKSLEHVKEAVINNNSNIYRQTPKRVPLSSGFGFRGFLSARSAQFFRGVCKLCNPTRHTLYDNVIPVELDDDFYMHAFNSWDEKNPFVKKTIPADDPVHVACRNFLSRLVLPELNLQQIRKVCCENPQPHWKDPVDEVAKCHYQRYLEVADQVSDPRKCWVKRGPDGTGRAYHSYLGLPRWIRGLCKYRRDDGTIDDLVEIDLYSSYWTMLASCLEDSVPGRPEFDEERAISNSEIRRDLSNGSFKGRILAAAELRGYNGTSDTLKADLMRDGLFGKCKRSDPDKGYHRFGTSPIFGAIEDVYSSLARFVRSWRFEPELFDGKVFRREMYHNGEKLFSRFLNDLEGNFMVDSVLVHLFTRGIPCMTIHDAISAPRELSEEVTGILRDASTRHLGFEAMFSVKNLGKQPARFDVFDEFDLVEPFLPMEWVEINSPDLALC